MVLEVEPRADLPFRVHYMDEHGIGEQRGAAGALSDAVQLASAFFAAREAASVSTTLCIVVIDGTLGAIVAWVGQWPPPESAPV